MQIRENESLAKHSTLRVGGNAKTFVVAESQSDILDALQTYKDSNILILGGGSNVVIADAGFDGVVIHIQSQGIMVEQDACSGAMVSVQAGVLWDEFVVHALSNEWSGIEALSGIPGLVGATPIQNVGAYGQEVSQTIARVKTFDRIEDKVKTFSAAECDFGYRTSRFKREPDRYVVLEVTFQLGLGIHSAPIQYGELAKKLEVELGKRSKSLVVREAVLALRKAKGMVLDANDTDTWSVGSFFTNPIISKELSDALPSSVTRWNQEEGVKISAASLLEHSGIHKGFSLDTPAQISSKHALAITNTANATASDVLELSQYIQEKVKSEFGIVLEIEPRVFGINQ